MASSIWFYVIFTALILAALALDLGIVHRTADVVAPKHAALWTAGWMMLALLFCAGLYVYKGPHTAALFLTGYVLEQSLSVDNILVIALIFTYFAIPAKYQYRILFWGILGALATRGLFIGLGALLIARFHWVLFLFGVIVIATAIRMTIHGHQEFDTARNPVMRVARRVLPLTSEYDGQRFFTIRNGKRLATPLALVLLLVEVTDLVFAVDSIPAIFGVTTDPFLVYTSNVFAILGLRSLFFLLSGMVDRFHLLRYGLAVVLTFVGVKMLIADHVRVPTVASLAVIGVILAASVALSFLFPRSGPVRPHPTDAKPEPLVER